MAVSTPFSVVVALCYCWTAYGMAGLRPGGDHIGMFGVIIVLCYLIAAQVSTACVAHLAC